MFNLFGNRDDDVKNELGGIETTTVPPVATNAGESSSVIQDSSAAAAPTNLEASLGQPGSIGHIPNEPVGSSLSSETGALSSDVPAPEKSQFETHLTGDSASSENHTFGAAELAPMAPYSDAQTKPPIDGSEIQAPAFSVHLDASAAAKEESPFPQSATAIETPLAEQTDKTSEEVASTEKPASMDKQQIVDTLVRFGTNMQTSMRGLAESLGVLHEYEESSSTNSQMPGLTGVENTPVSNASAPSDQVASVPTA